MTVSAPEPPPRGIPLNDVEVADRIARAVRGRKGADRNPTLEQLMEAFGAGEPDRPARRRIAAALELAGVTSSPDILEAPVGTRLALGVLPGAGTGGPPGDPGRIRRRRVIVGLLALVALVGAAGGAATLAGQDEQRRSDRPSGTAGDGSTDPSGATGSSGATGGESARGTNATSTREAARPAARRPSRAARARTRSRARARARSRARRARAVARRQVRVTLFARQPTYLCVDSGPETSPRFEGTLRGTRIFRGRRVRVNVGLGSSTSMRVNGDRVMLRGSPAGYDLSPRSRRPLGSGRRPDCR